MEEEQRWPGHTGMVQKLVACRALQSGGGLDAQLHLHDDGFLGDLSLLLSDYKENSGIARVTDPQQPQLAQRSVWPGGEVTAQHRGARSKPCLAMALGCGALGSSNLR